MTSPTPPEPSEAVGDVIDSRTVREVERENTMFLQDLSRPGNAAKTTEERTRPHLFHHYNESIDKAALSNGRMRNLMMGRGRACDDCRWNKIRVCAMLTGYISNHIQIL